MQSVRRRLTSGQRLHWGALAGIALAVSGLIGAGSASAQTVEPEVVRAFETSEWDPPSGDPSGAVQVGDRLVVVDSEVEETTGECYGGAVNLWEVSLSDPGNVIRTASLESEEPTGVGYDPENELLFVSDDENSPAANKIWVVDYDDPSDVVAEIEIREILAQQNIVVRDVEDPAYDPDTDELFAVGLADLPGGDTEAVLFRITSTSPDFSSGVMIDVDSINHLDSVDEFEGMAIDPNTGLLLVATKEAKQIYEIDRNDPGFEPVRVIDASKTGLQNISGLAAVDVGGETHYWVTDRRSDCGGIDGQLVELATEPVTNRAPTLTLQGVPTQIVAGQTLSFTAQGSDPDPGQTLAYSLISGPQGATINAQTGAVTWVASGNGQVSFTVRVTDNGTPAMSAQRSATVTVVQPNRAPELQPIDLPEEVIEGQTLAFVAQATDPDTGQTLTFSLSGQPVGATIHPTLGEFSWLAQGVGEHQFTVRVTDNGTPPLSDSEVITVTVIPASNPGDPDDPGDPGDPGGPADPGDPGDPGGPGGPGDPGGPKPPSKPPAEPNPPGGTPDNPFVDDNGHVFEADIEWLANSGITKGCNPPTNDRFCPDDFVTRGQMAAFLVRALGYTDNGGGNKFVDDNGSVFEGDIDRLATAGVTKGCNPPRNDRFCPDDFVTRGQMAAFLVRALGYSSGGGGNPFVDDDGHVFEADIEALAAAGVTRGCNPPTNDRFCPDDFVTRGQMAAFLHRALGD